MRELWCASGGPWCRVGVRAAIDGGFHQAARSPAGRLAARRPGRTTTCSTGRRWRAAHPVDQVAAQPARLVARQRRDHDLVRGVVLEARCMMLVSGSGCVDVARHVEAGLAQLGRACCSSRSCAAAAPSPAAALGRDHGEAVRRRGRAALERLDQLPARRPSGSRRTSTWRIGSSLRSTITCSTGSAGPLLDALDQVAAQPARARIRIGRDDDLVGAPLADRVLRRPGTGPGPSPRRCASMPSSRRRSSVSSSRIARGRADAVVVDHEAASRAGSAGRSTVQRIGPRAARRSIASSSFCPPTVSFATTSTWAGCCPAGWLRPPPSAHSPPCVSVAVAVAVAVAVRRRAPHARRRRRRRPAPSRVAVQDRVHGARARRTRTGRRRPAGSRRS